MWLARKKTMWSGPIVQLHSFGARSISVQEFLMSFFIYGSIIKLHCSGGTTTENGQLTPKHTSPIQSKGNASKVSKKNTLLVCLAFFAPIAGGVGWNSTAGIFVYGLFLCPPQTKKASNKVQTCFFCLPGLSLYTKRTPPCFIHTPQWLMTLFRGLTTYNLGMQESIYYRSLLLVCNRTSHPKRPIHPSWPGVSTLYNWALALDEKGARDGGRSWNRVPVLQFLGGFGHLFPKHPWFFSREKTPKKVAKEILLFRFFFF